MKVEDLKGTKIYLSNEDDRVEFQEKVFELGVRWANKTLGFQLVTNSFYYISNDMHMTSEPISFSSSFNRCNYNQIFLEDVLAIEKPKEECKFKPYDRVLVRDGDDLRWKPRLFAWRIVDYKKYCPYPFETTDGDLYGYCIPYKGNEELANTTKSKEE